MPVPARADRDRNHQRRARRAVRGPVHGRARPGGCGPSGSAPLAYSPDTGRWTRPGGNGIHGHRPANTARTRRPPEAAGPRSAPAKPEHDGRRKQPGGGRHQSRRGTPHVRSRQPGQAHGDHFPRSRTGYDTAAAPATAGMESAVITLGQPPLGPGPGDAGTRRNRPGPASRRAVGPAQERRQGGAPAEDPGPRPRRLSSAPEDSVSREKNRAEGRRENAIKKCTEL